jgi:serine/threonine protein phosphatase PrpC
MGAYLNAPKTDKATISKENNIYKVVASEMQGWRVSMEDAHAVHLDSEFACLGVFDGHGGKEVALWVGDHIVDTLLRNVSF